MTPFGNALIACLGGEKEAAITVRRDDGLEFSLPASHFFRDEQAFSPLEQKALELCSGRVLDIGAGAGSIALALQRQGHHVTALDVCPAAVTTAQRRGVESALCANIMSFGGGPFDTLLMLGHGIGMVETLTGLRHFLGHARSLLAGDGHLILDSLDVRETTDPQHLAYHEANRHAGRYIGEIRMQFEFRGSAGPWCGWLQIDFETLNAVSESLGWTCEVCFREATGDYLARLARRFP